MVTSLERYLVSVFIGALLLVTAPLLLSAQEPPSAGSSADPVSIRTLFLPENQKEFAGSELFIPLSPDSSIPPPKYAEDIRKSLDIDEESTVLVIGRAAGFMAAYLSQYAETVIVSELDPGQLNTNERVWNDLGLRNIESASYTDYIRQTDFDGFDAVMVHGIVREIPPSLFNSLKNGGILLTPLSNFKEVQMTLKFIKTPDGLKVSGEDLSFFPNRPFQLRDE